MTILLVEDDTSSRNQLAALLRRVGYHVAVAGDGAEALAKMRAGPPALVLLDMVMAGMDGWKFLEEKRKDATLRAVPVIIVSGLGVGSAEWARMLGAVGFFRKPLDVERLLETVQLQRA